MCFMSTADILVSSLALMVQFSLSYNKVGRASVLYNFTLVFFRVLFDKTQSSDYLFLNYPCIPSPYTSPDNRLHVVPTIIFESRKRPSDERCLMPTNILIRPCVLECRLSRE
jgi:hypothetical protein